MATQNRLTGLSPKEAELIATISESRMRVFTRMNAVRLLNAEKRPVARLLSSLSKKRKLQRIEKGKYLLIPPVA